MQRRTILQLLAGTVLLKPLASLASLAQAPSPLVTCADDAFLDDLQRRGCLYFTEQVGAKTGQILDRAAALPTPPRLPARRDPRPMASIAATGFGLSALCIAEYRGYAPREKIVAQVRRTLRFHLGNLPHEHGFFYHFNDVDLGGVFPGSEVSPIDTALLLCGVLTARAHFHWDPQIVDLATRLYQRVDWPWMLNGGPAFAMGWRSARWYDADVLGIDLGIGVLMAENLRTGFVWKTFARNPEVLTAMQKAGFRRV